jgi:hypothetical protein
MRAGNEPNRGLGLAFGCVTARMVSSGQQPQPAVLWLAESGRSTVKDDPERTVATLRHFAESASDDEHAINIDACRQLDLGPRRRELFDAVQEICDDLHLAASAGHGH